MDKHWKQLIWPLYGTGKLQKKKAWFNMRTATFLLMSEQQVIVLFLFCFFSGSRCVTARLPEQYGLRLETAQLHRCHSWGEYTPSGTGPPGLLWWVTEELALIVDSKHIERQCCAATTTYWPEEDWLHACNKHYMIPAHFVTSLRISLKHKMLSYADWAWAVVVRKYKGNTNSLN